MATNTESVDLVGDEAATNLARAALFAALSGHSPTYRSRSRCRPRR